MSGAGRLVLKDVVILAGAWLILADTARVLLRRHKAEVRSVPKVIALSA
jgi:uncharacterized membrane protein YkgB